MSETFRNTTFLIAIRDAGFVCNELLGVYGGVNDSTTWTATCSEMLAYTVGVASYGALHVEPMLQHLDGDSRRARPREPGGESVLPQQRLPPQPVPPRRYGCAQTLSESSTATIASVPCAGAMTCAPATPLICRNPR